LAGLEAVLKAKRNAAQKPVLLEQQLGAERTINSFGHAPMTKRKKSKVLA
jgi:hypothetical protein